MWIIGGKAQGRRVPLFAIEYLSDYLCCLFLPVIFVVVSRVGLLINSPHPLSFDVFAFSVQVWSFWAMGVTGAYLFRTIVQLPIQYKIRLAASRNGFSFLKSLVVSALCYAIGFAVCLPLFLITMHQGEITLKELVRLSILPAAALPIGLFCSSFGMFCVYLYAGTLFDDPKLASKPGVNVTLPK